LPAAPGRRSQVAPRPGASEPGRVPERPLTSANLSTGGSGSPAVWRAAASPRHRPQEPGRAVDSAVLRPGTADRKAHFAPPGRGVAPLSSPDPWPACPKPRRCAPTTSRSGPGLLRRPFVQVANKARMLAVRMAEGSLRAPKERHSRPAFHLLDWTGSLWVRVFLHVWRSHVARSQHGLKPSQVYG